MSKTLTFFDYRLEDSWYRFFSDGQVDRIQYDEDVDLLLFYKLESDDAQTVRRRLKKELNDPPGDWIFNARKVEEKDRTMET